MCVRVRSTFVCRKLAWRDRGSDNWLHMCVGRADYEEVDRIIACNVFVYISIVPHALLFLHAKREGHRDSWCRCRRVVCSGAPKISVRVEVAQEHRAGCYQVPVLCGLPHG